MNTALVKTISDADLELLARAHRQLEHPSLAARLSSVVGTPVELAVKLLPPNWYRRLHTLVESALTKGYEASLSTLRRKQVTPSNEQFHSSVVAAAGFTGGLFGLPGLAIELPLTTTVMLRSIAEIARSEGEDLDEIDTRVACLEVFALGGDTEVDDATETGYYGVRLALASYLSSVSGQLLESGVGSIGTPVVVQAISWIARPFGVNLTQRAAVRVLPVLGAVSVATVNVIFIHHFQRMARAHFTVRRLERIYGKQTVQAVYESIK